MILCHSCPHVPHVPCWSPAASAAHQKGFRDTYINSIGFPSSYRCRAQHYFWSERRFREGVIGCDKHIVVRVDVAIRAAGFWFRGAVDDLSDLIAIRLTQYHNTTSTCRQPRLRGFEQILYLFKHQRYVYISLQNVQCNSAVFGLIAINFVKLFFKTYCACVTSFMHIALT